MKQAIVPPPPLATVASRPRASRRGELRAATQEYAPVVLLTTVYSLAALFVSQVLGWPLNAQPAQASSLIFVSVLWLGLLAILIALPVLGLFKLVRSLSLRAGRNVGVNPLPELWRLLRFNRLVALVIVFSVYSLFIAVFIAFKRAIPEVNPFAWDVAFMELDRLLHFGNDPWRLLHPLLGNPATTDFLDRLYYAWFPINYMCIVGFVWCENRALRIQFFLSFWLVWVLLGTVLAYLFTSVGPCYYGFLVDGANPFAPLMEYLHQVDERRGLVAVYVQGELWADFSGSSTHLLMRGISAMPSVHIALPVLFAIGAWRVHRNLGIALAVYAFAIFLGSIHLGWHYAVDGYASALVVPLVWWFAGGFARRYNERLARAEKDGALR